MRSQDRNKKTQLMPKKTVDKSGEKREIGKIKDFRLKVTNWESESI